MGLLRLGFLANFISEPVLKGFIIGLALTIIIGQVPKLFGIEKGKGDFFEQLWGLIRHLGDTQGRTLGRAASLAIVLGLRRWLPMVPGSLVAVISASSPSSCSTWTTRASRSSADRQRAAALGLPDGVGVTTTSAPPAPAAGIMLVGFAEGLGAAKTYAARAHYEVDANRELLGLGAANVGSGLSQRDGGQRQPLEDGGQRLSRRHARRCPGSSSPCSPSSPCCSSPACSRTCRRRRSPPS